MGEADVTTEPGISEDVRAFLVRFADLYQAHDVEGVLRDAITDDVQFIDHRPLGADPVVGADAARQWFETLIELMPDWRVQVHALAQQGDVYLARDTYAGEGSDVIGAAMTEWFVVDRLRDGKLEREDIFADEESAAALFEQLTADGD